MGSDSSVDIVMIYNINRGGGFRCRDAGVMKIEDETAAEPLRNPLPECRKAQLESIYTNLPG